MCVVLTAAWRKLDSEEDRSAKPESTVKEHSWCLSIPHFGSLVLIYAPAPGRPAAPRNRIRQSSRRTTLEAAHRWHQKPQGLAHWCYSGKRSLEDHSVGSSYRMAAAVGKYKRHFLQLKPTAVVILW